jgi:hypothetical protein
MAIIQCPACDERISSRATQCPKCKLDFETVDDFEAQQRKLSSVRFKKQMRLQNMSFIAVLLFATGVLFLYFSMEQPDGSYALTGRVMLGVGFVGYIAARVMLMLHKRS